MALDSKYIVASDLESYFVDKDTGQALAGGKLLFYRDTARNVPKQVYQLTGAPPTYSFVSMGTSITLSNSGTVQNANGDNEVIYWYPYDSNGDEDFYYVEVQNSNGVTQFTREVWPAASGSGGSATSQNIAPTDNQISNSCFQNIFLNEDIDNVFTVSSLTPSIFQIAPNWDFEIAGTGTVTVKRVAVTGSQNLPTSPPYYLDINVGTGITQCLLVQTFKNNSGLWSSTTNNSIYLYGSALIAQVSGGSSSCVLNYQDGANTPVQILSAATAGVDFTLLTGSSTQIPLSTNATRGTDGFVRIYWSFLQLTQWKLTSTQIIPTDKAPTTPFLYDLNSQNRDEAYQGDFLLPDLQVRRQQGFVGWDFTNRLILTSSTNTFPNITNSFLQNFENSAANYGATYVKTSSGIVNAYRNFSSGSETNSSGIYLNPLSANSSCYFQYAYLRLTDNSLITHPRLAKQIGYGGKFCVNINGYSISEPNTTPIKVRVYVFSANAYYPPSTEIGTIAANGTFTLTASPANFNKISRSNLPDAEGNFSTLDITKPLNKQKLDLQFSGWEITDPIIAKNCESVFFIITFAWAAITPNLANFVIDDINFTFGSSPSRSLLLPKPGVI